MAGDRHDRHRGGPTAPVPHRRSGGRAKVNAVRVLNVWTTPTEMVSSGRRHGGPSGEDRRGIVRRRMNAGRYRAPERHPLMDYMSHKGGGGLGGCPGLGGRGGGLARGDGVGPGGRGVHSLGTLPPCLMVCRGASVAGPVPRERGLPRSEHPPPPPPRSHPFTRPPGPPGPHHRTAPQRGGDPGVVPPPPPPAPAAGGGVRLCRASAGEAVRGPITPSSASAGHKPGAFNVHKCRGGGVREGGAGGGQTPTHPPLRRRC